MNRPQSRRFRVEALSLSALVLALAVLSGGPAVGQVASIAMSKTVGTLSNPVGTTNALSITGPGAVYYFYRIVNTGALSVTVQDLVDSQLGHLLGSPSTLAPGGSFTVTQSAFLTRTTVNLATVTASELLSTTIIATGTDAATVSVLPGPLGQAIPVLSRSGLATLLVLVAGAGLVLLRKLV